MKKEHAASVIQNSVRSYFNKRFEKSIINGDFEECTKFFWIKPTSDHIRVCLKFRKRCYVSIVRWLEQRIFYFDSPRSHQASQDGELQSLIQEYSQGAILGITEFMKAICYGHIHICQWLLNKLGHQYVTKNGKELMVCALNSGEVRSCQFLIKNGVKPHCEYFPLLNGCFFEEKYIPTYIWMILEGTFEDKQGNLLKKCTQEVIPKICQSLSQVHLSNFKRNLEKFGKIGNILRLTHSLNSGLFSSVPEGPLDMIREFSEIYKDDKLLRIKKFYLSLGQQSRTKYRNRHG